MKPMKAVHPSSVLIVLLLSFFPVEFALVFAPFCTWRFNSRAICGGTFVIFYLFLWFANGSCSLLKNTLKECSRKKHMYQSEHDASFYNFRKGGKKRKHVTTGLSKWSKQTENSLKKR